jgi:hypothetical protein
MKLKFLFLSLLVIFSLGSCSKEEAVSGKTPFSEEARIKAIVDAVVDVDAPLHDEPLTFSNDQIRTIYENQSIWTLEEIESVIRDRSASFQEKYARLAQKIDRTSSETTIESFQKRSTGFIQDSNPDHLAQVLAAAGTTVGQRSSLNIFRPINDNGTVTFTDIFVAERRQAVQVQDNLVEYLPESVVFEFQVSGGNWLISADIVRNVGSISDTISYCFTCPSGPLIWNPTLDSPANDDVIEGPLPNNIVSISSNGLVPPVPLD